MTRGPDWPLQKEQLHRLGLFSLEGTTEVDMTEVYTAVRDENKTRGIK